MLRFMLVPTRRSHMLGWIVEVGFKIGHKYSQKRTSTRSLKNSSQKLERFWGFFSDTSLFAGSNFDARILG